MKSGPKHDRYDDGPYLYRMAQIIDAEKISAWQAAQRVVDDALPGNSDYAKARRIHSKFLDRFGEIPVEQILTIFRLAEIGRSTQEAMAPMLEYLDRLRRSEVLEKVPLMWEDEQFMARYGDLLLHEALERWNYLHPARTPELSAKG